MKLSSFFNYYYKLDLIDRNPVDKVQVPQQCKNVIRSSTVSENEQILEFVSTGELDGRQAVFQKHTRNRDLAILMLIIGAGLRASDCVELNITDIHLEEHFILIKRRNKSKNVYLSDKICKALSNYLIERLNMIPLVKK